MKLTEQLRRILSALLVFVLIFSLAPVNTIAAEKPVDAAVFFSDLHTSKSNYKESTLTGVMTTLKNAGLSISSVTSAGDAFSVNEDSSSSSGPYTGYTATLTGYIRNVLGNVPVNYVWSDHDRYAVQEDGTTLLDKTSRLIYGAGSDGVYGTDDDANYYVYSLSMGDLCSYDRYNAGFHYTASSNNRASRGFTATVDQAVANFQADAAKLKKDRPLFIASHQPLFDNRNDNAFAEVWFDAINEVAEEMDVAFFYGHNHKYDTGSDYYYAKGSSMPVATADGWNYNYETGVGWKPSIDLKPENKTLNFTHMCAGYLAPSSTGSTSSTTRQGTVMAVTIYEDSIQYVTYNAGGVYTGSYALNVTVPRAFAGGTTEPEVPAETEATEPETEATESTEPAVTPDAGKEGTIWRKASAITNGKRYLLVNYGYNDSGIGTYAVNSTAGAAEVDVLTDETGAYVVTDDLSLAWTAKANNGQFEMANAQTGNYLRAANYVYGTSGSDISVNASTTSGSTYTNWSIETKSGKTIVAVRRATSGNFYPVCYTGGIFQAFNSSQVSSRNNWLAVFEETDEKAGHEHIYETVTVDATCTETGSVTTRCTVCDEETVEVLAATGHTYSCTTTEATCGADGSKVYTCSVCSDTYSESIPATGNHTYTAETTDPTCTEAGSTVYTCVGCGHSYTEVLAAFGHAYTGTVTAPTCTEVGFTTYTCDSCGHSYTGEEIAAFGHTYDSVISATCTEDGYVVYTCRICGDTYNGEAVAAFGHSYETTTVAPGCATDGYTTYVCAACGHTHTGDEVAALGHSYEAVVTEATCTEAGFTTFTCTVCGYGFDDNHVEALGHDYESVVTAPTFETEGYTTHTCRVCGDVTVDSFVPVLSHDYETVTVEATCTEDGSVTHTCVTCGYAYTEVLPAPGHSYETVTTDATCVANGSQVSTCAVCGAVESAVIPALGHSYETTVIDPTCTAAGYTTYTCACGDVVTEEIPALGHSYESSYTAPTCTESGGTAYTCTVCGDAYTEAEAALGHAYESRSAAPTCTASGYTTYTCTACGDSYTADETAALGHSYAEVVTQPTCTDSGYTTYTCTTCADSYTGNETAASGHSYSCEESDGWLVYTCDVCGDSYSEKTDLTYTKVSSLSGDNRYVITLFSGNTYYALSHAGNRISAVQITVSNNEITSEVTEDLIWTYESSKLSYQDGSTTYYLYAKSASGWWAWFTAPTLTLSTTSSSTVSFSSSKLKLGGYYLRYSSGNISLNRSAYCFAEE